MAILVFQAPSYLLNLKMQAANALATGISWTVFMIPATIILAAGSMFILWLGERITDKGVGNGISYYYDWYYRPFATGFRSGDNLSFAGNFRWWSYYVYCRDSYPLCCCLCINSFGARHT